MTPLLEAMERCPKSAEHSKQCIVGQQQEEGCRQTVVEANACSSRSFQQGPLATIAESRQVLEGGEKRHGRASAGSHTRRKKCYISLPLPGRSAQVRREEGKAGNKKVLARKAPAYRLAKSAGKGTRRAPQRTRVCAAARSVHPPVFAAAVAKRPPKNSNAGRHDGEGEREHTSDQPRARTTAQPVPNASRSSDEFCRHHRSAVSMRAERIGR